jgi:lactate permease
MTYYLWALPAITVLVAILSGRVNATIAAILGLTVAVPVALLYGPAPLFSYGQLGNTLLRGVWIGTTIAPYILGGLLFWQVAAPSPAQTSLSPATPSIERDAPLTPLASRRLVFFACFLVGPFAESATGFGVGMLGTVMLLRPLGFAPRHLMVFALTSQTFIPWGAMSSGTLLAAAYARISPTQLALYTLIPVSLLMLVWLPLFWRTARLAGVPASLTECLKEAAWVASGLAFLGFSTACLGPETSLLAAFGPLIVLRYFVDFRPDRRQTMAAARKAQVYIVLVSALALSRLVPGVKGTLATWGKVMPFDDLPVWAPLFHAGTWFIVGGFVTSIIRKQGTGLGAKPGLPGVPANMRY